MGWKQERKQKIQSELESLQVMTFKFHKGEKVHSKIGKDYVIEGVVTDTNAEKNLIQVQFGTSTLRHWVNADLYMLEDEVDLGPRMEDLVGEDLIEDEEFFIGPEMYDEDETF